MEKFYITFGYDSPFKKSYVIIHADYETARSIALEGFKYWANIYSEDEWNKYEVPMSDKYNLTLLCEIEATSDESRPVEVWR